MQRMLVLWALLSLVYLVESYNRTRFPGPYCQNRREQCCPNRDDECTVPIRLGPHSSLCYCDMFCYQHRVEDCCPDYESVCQGPGPLTDNDCVHSGSYYKPEDRVTVDCNEWFCTTEFDAKGKPVRYYWGKENDACVNSDELLNRISLEVTGWLAQKYEKFRGIKLKDALKYFLGTVYPRQKVVDLSPLDINAIKNLPTTFDSRFNREKWQNLIHEPMDQGMCGSSWAFSTIGVASDRWAIQTEGSFNDLLSVQSLISCNLAMKDPCQGSTVEAGWWLLHEYGAVSDRCYPYEHMGGNVTEKLSCQRADYIRCADGTQADAHQTSPAYRIKQDEGHIMHEIYKEGPVQAIIKVRADFFLYKSGVYAYSRQPEQISSKNHTLEGIHSVKILGWGVERGVKYWLAANSWGQSWGDQGYFKIKRGENESGIEEFVVGVWVKAENQQINPRRHRDRSRRV